MKKSSVLFSFILPILFYISIESIIQVNSLTHINAKCWDYSNPFKPWEKDSSVCYSQGKKKERERSLDDISNNIFQFDCNCNFQDFQDRILCNKVKDGEMIKNLINFNTPIKVNVTFVTIPLQDDENKIVKQYPQALVKQFLLEPEPQSYFNCENIVSLDFQYNILSELIQSFTGLDNQLITPDPELLLVKSSNQVKVTSLTSSFNILYIFIIALIFFSYTF
ncbi:unnamed protein product [Rhizophagus irregularis]|nr:unnamed protein product [Rhizophagus irregularis]